MEQTKSRSPGLHLSDVIHNMDVTLLKTQETAIDEGTLFQFEKGYLWETALSRAFGEKVAQRIGELTLDGIIMSPDGVSYEEDGTFILEEYKCTALSADRSPSAMWKWLMQVKGYCKAIGTTKCIFRILHHVDITRNPDKCYAVWEMVFTQNEIDENWEAILNHAKTMKEGVR